MMKQPVSCAKKLLQSAIILMTRSSLFQSELSAADSTRNFLTDVTFTNAEKIYIEQLQEQKKLIIATRMNKVTVYEKQAGGAIRGNHYALIKDFTDTLGIEPDIKIVSSFSEYFMINGIVPDKVKEDPNYSYTPDLIKQVDLYLDTITVLPWREKLLTFIPILPSRILLVSRAGEEVRSIKETQGKRISVMKDSSYATKWDELSNKYNLNYTYIYAPSTLESLKKLVSNEADITGVDSNRAIFEVNTLKGLNICIPISEVQHIAWAVQKENTILSSILSKYIKYCKKSGSFDRHWNNYYGIAFSYYLETLGYK